MLASAVKVGNMVVILAIFILLPLTLVSNAMEPSTGLKYLPAPKTEGTISVEAAISKRRSIRSFSRESLMDDVLSQILWAAQGITAKQNHRRAAPSAGATYPLETYLVTAKGVYHYHPDKHALTEVKQGDARKALAEAALGQRWLREAPATLVFTAVPERTTRRYGSRGMMYIHMEAGHAAENVHLQAVALGLGSVPIGAFSEQDIAKVLNLPKGEIPLYLIPVGKEKTE